VTAERRWQDSDAPDAQFASVFGGEGAVYLASRQQNEVLVTDSGESDWRTVPLPTRSVEVTSVASDPHDADRLYLGTRGEGVFIFEGKSEKVDPAKRKTAETAVAAGGTKE